MKFIVNVSKSLSSTIQRWYEGKVVENIAFNTVQDMGEMTKGRYLPVSGDELARLRYKYNRLQRNMKNMREALQNER